MEVPSCTEGDMLKLFCGTVKNSLNNSSVVVKFMNKTASVIFPGDLEEKGEERLLKTSMASDCDVLTASHHGSRFGTGKKLLEALTPEYLVISVGQRNSYGHPSPEVLERAEKQGARVFRTDRDGAVIMEISDSGTEIFGWLTRE